MHARPRTTNNWLPSTGAVPLRGREWLTLLLPLLWVVGCPLDERQLHPIPDHGSGGSAGDGESSASAGGSGAAGGSGGTGSDGVGGSTSSGGSSSTATESTSTSASGGSTTTETTSTASVGSEAGGSSNTSSTTGGGGAGNDRGTGECPDLDENEVADCDETLLENASFNANLNEWHEEANTLANWEDDDALGDDASGSVSVTNKTYYADREGEIMRGVWQCVPATGGKTYQLLTQVRVSTINAQGGISVWFYNQANCVGTIVTASTPFLGTTGDWSLSETTAEAPPEAKSMLVRLVVSKAYTALPVTIDFDNVFGDALYCAAPEQIRNLREIDARTDIWALGCILHELLTGAPLYQAESAPSLLAMIAADPPTPLRALRSDVPVALETVVLRCLEKERSSRYPTLGELAQALKPFALPEAKNSADRVMRTLGRSSRQGLSQAAMVHVGPAPTPPMPPPPSLPARSTPFPSMPPPPARIDLREPRSSPALLAGLGLAAGVVLALVGVKLSLPPAEPAPNLMSAEAATTQLNLQREIVREIAALRAAREEPANAEPETGTAPKSERVAPKARAEQERPRAKSKREPSENGARRRASESKEPAQPPPEAEPAEVRPELRSASAKGSGDDLFGGVH